MRIEDVVAVARLCPMALVSAVELVEWGSTPSPLPMPPEGSPIAAVTEMGKCWPAASALGQLVGALQIGFVDGVAAGHGSLSWRWPASR